MGETHFGFEKVQTEEKAKRVEQVFADIAKNYDLINDLASLGLHRYWKRRAIAGVSSSRPHRVVDLAGGTGDLTRLMMTQSPESLVILSDINQAMLMAGGEKLHRENLHPPLLQCDAESLPFEDASVDLIMIGFGLRNVTHKLRALKEMRRVLRRQGQVLVLEFSRVAAALKPFYEVYSFHVLPLLGKWLAGNEAGYRYLVESIRMHPDQATLAAMMREAGFARVSYTNLTAGIVAIHTGFVE
ncbi:MAG: class I SAM-dependent methyltransferase [Burkholderiales bacterium]|jgi:demethylmenaquinone methyltransferase/2-methoxy-6-polyprenyl-1,4-benzoquinol methylase|nr:class I SAM-dependent methyltransferase [Burkholderiales bacterium]